LSIRKRWVGLSLVLIVGVAAVALVAIRQASPLPSASGDEIASLALSAFKQAGSVQLTKPGSNTAGTGLDTKVRMARGGQSLGQIASGTSASLVTVNHRVFLRADAEFWMIFGVQGLSSMLAGRWVYVPELKGIQGPPIEERRSFFDFDTFAAKVLQPFVEQRGWTRVGHATVNGRSAIVIRNAKAEVSVADHGKPVPLQVRFGDLASPSTPFSVDLSEYGSAVDVTQPPDAINYLDAYRQASS
jgi:hypothetical protein